MSYSNTKSLRFEEAERNPLVLIDVATLTGIVGNIINNALNEWRAHSDNSIANYNDRRDSDLLNMAETIELLKVSKVTIHNWKKAGIIKSHKMGRKLYFKESELLEAIKRQKYSI
jgi:excisionase family DNA binding protein